MRWSFVYEWIVVIRPFFTPNASFITLTTGAMQLVVQDALETILSFAASYLSSFTPSTKVGIPPPFCRGGYNNFLSACLKVGASLFSIAKYSG